MVLVVADDVLDPTALYRLRDGAYAADLMIAAVAEFDLFSWLAEYGPVSSAQLCAAMGWAARPADVLLTLAAAHGLVRRQLDDGDRVTITELARQHLVAGSRFDLRAYYASLRERPAVREFVGVLRTDAPAAWASAAVLPAPADGGVRDEVGPPGRGQDWSGRLGEVEFAQRITAAMDSRGAFLGPALADAVADVPVSRLLDIGGSSGVYAAALIEARPDATATVFERSPVDAAARTLLEGRGLADRVEVVTGDMFTEPLPRGHDVHLFSQVLHDWDTERVGALLAASFVALEPGGWLLDHDTHINAEKSGPRPVAEYSALLMHSTPGKCWSVTELGELAAATGFVDVAHRPTAGDRGVLLARKPGR
jgi:3-hydroxy-5-methyl-1-naphthoate 3-O-methyltransferase